MVANPYPYDANGYCVHCRVGQYKPHAPECAYRQQIERVTKDAETKNG